jgi:hypothetical protein
MWFVFFELSHIAFHMCERVRNSFGLSGLRLRRVRYLFG